MKKHYVVLTWSYLFLFFFFPEAYHSSKEKPNLVESLPKHGYGVLNRIRNKSPYPASLVFEKTVQDELPDGTTIRIKHVKTNTYYAARQNAEKKWVFTPDAVSSDDKATEFTVLRKLTSPPLRDWIGIESNSTDELTLQFTPGSREAVGFVSDAFEDDDAKNAHWQILGSSLESCHLKSRDGGVIAPFRGTVDVKVEKDKEEISTSYGLVGICKPIVNHHATVSIFSLSTQGFLRQTGNNSLMRADVGRASIDNNSRYRVEAHPSQVARGFIGNGNDMGFFSIGGNMYVGRDIEQGEVRCDKGFAWQHFGKRIYKRSTRGHQAPQDVKTDQPVRFGMDVSIQSLRANDMRERKKGGIEGFFGGKERYNATVNQHGWWFGVGDKGIRIRHGNMGTNDETIYQLFDERGSLPIKTGPHPGALAQAQSPTAFAAVAIQNASVWYAIDHSGVIHKSENGAWSVIQSSVQFRTLDVNSKGDIVAVGFADNKPYLRTSNGWSPLPPIDDANTVVVAPDIRDFTMARSIAPMAGMMLALLQGKAPGGILDISIISQREMWALGTNGIIYTFNGEQWKRQTPSDAIIKSMSASEENACWCVDTKNRVWQFNFDNQTWSIVDAPAGNPAIKQIAVRNNNAVFMIDSTDRMLYAWDGKTWNASEQWLSWIATSAGITKKIIPGRTEKRDLYIGVATDAEGKNLEPSPDTEVAIEIIELGQGGNIDPQESVDFELPVSQKPVVSGFAETVVPIKKGATLKLQPLLGKGAAWLEESFPVNNRCTIGFVAKAGDEGDIQIMLGREINSTFDYKIIIGGKKNTEAAIIQRTINGSEISDDVVCSIGVKENPLAATSPGNFVPYWITYDSGLIIVGMGLPGEHPFMAYRTDDPIELINRVGLSCNKEPVEFADIQMYEPVVSRPQTRVFYEGSESIPVSSTIGWTQTPLRIADQGSIACDIKGAGKVAVILGQDKDQTKPHYKIVFGDEDGTKITIYKFIKNEYIKRGSCDVVELDGLFLSPDYAVQPWISFNQGLFIMGYGEIGENTSFIYQDVNPLADIQQIGFALEGGSCEVTNIAIADTVQLALASSQDYKKPSAKPRGAYEGNAKVILPFEYRISQVDQSVKFDDLINNTTFYPGATPQQGALYYFTLSIEPDGAPKLEWTKAPENPQEIKVKQMIVEAKASAELEKEKAEIMRADGQRLKELQQALGDAERNRAEASMNQAERSMTLGAIVAEKTIDKGLIGGVAGGIALAAAGADAGFKMAAADRAFEAARQRDIAGAQAASSSQQRALELEQAAAAAKFNAALLEGQAAFAFRSNDSYVFVDEPVRTALGTADVPAEIVEARTKVEALIQELDTLQPNTPANFETLVAKTRTIMHMLTHSYIVSEIVSKKIASIFEALFTSYPKTFTTKKADPRVVNSLFNLFISAINNAYLTGSDAEQKETYYIWANKVAHDLLEDTNNITLDNCFGEYIWLPVTASDETLEISMELAGTKDAFICFSDDSVMVRNSGNEMYEIHLGAFDNKSMVMRLQSLGKAFKTIDKKEFPAGCLNPFKPTSITVSYKKGVITVTDGAGKSTTWTDPYPVKGITWIGISSWESPITFDKIRVNKELISKSNKKTTTAKLANSSKKESVKSAKKSVSKKQTIKKSSAKKGKKAALKAT